MSNEIKVVVSDANKIITKVNWLSSNDYTSAEKNKVANVPNDTNAQLAEKVQNFKIKNEVVNGDFSVANTLGWSPASGRTILSNENGQLKVVLKIHSLFTQFQYSINNRGNNICYTRTKFLSSKSFDIKRYGLYIGDAQLPTKNIGVGTTFLSVIGVSSFDYLAYGGINSGLDIDDYFYIDNVIFVDLTATFGTGNEPTKLEMDELMNVIPNGWWAGELTLTQKQFITWQLNLIRKNTNAIIALGGTII